MHQNDQIMEQFLAFARLRGVNIDIERLEADGRIHRADVGDLPSGKSDAGYLLRPDGTGWITNFKADGKPIQFKPELARELTPEETARIEVQREVWRKQQAERQAVAVEDAIQRWEASHEPKAFPYLQAPKLESAGLRQGRAQLLVPMMAIDADGEPGWVGMQRITWAGPGHSAEKRFVSGTPTKGAFAVIPVVGADVEAPLRAYEAACKADQVVFCEGIGTALAIHQATGLPVIAAMSAQNLPDVARSLHDKLQGRAVIYADNDGEKAQFKGQAYAVRAARILGGARTRIALPEKPGGITPSGYDARDQLRDRGPDAIRATMAATLDAWQLERRLPPEIVNRNRPGLVRQQAPQQNAAQQPDPFTTHQEQPMNERTLADIAEQIKDATKLHNDLARSADATPEAKKAARDQIDALKKERDQVRRAAEPVVQGQTSTAAERVAEIEAALFRLGFTIEADLGGEDLGDAIMCIATDDHATPEQLTPEIVALAEEWSALAGAASRESETSARAEQATHAVGHALQGGQEEPSLAGAFDALNQAAAEPGTLPVDTQGTESDRTEQADEQGQAETTEDRLLREYAVLAEPVRAQRAKAQYDLDARHREQREALFGSLDQLRADKMRELNGMAEEHRRSLIAIEVAKAVEAMQKQQMSERRSLQSELPDVPSYRNFLEDRAANDPVAARMLDEERSRGQVPEAVKGKRVSSLEPAVLEGLTHEIEDGPAGKAIHYARDGERVMSDRGERVDLYKMDDREIEAALRLAEQKYDMEKGLVLTGSREFQQRAAEVAGRMGLKIQNEDLRKAWEQGRLTALQADEAEHALAATVMNGSAEPLGSIARPSSLEASRAQGDQAVAATYPVDKPFLAAESVLSHLPSQGWDALAAAGQGHPLTPEQKAWLESPARPVLIDEHEKLTELGQLAYDRLQSRSEEEREMLQQQLRTRNIDEELEKRKREKGLEQQATEHKEEVAMARDATAGLQRADDRHADSADPQQELEEQQIKVPEPALSSRSRPRLRDMSRGM
ncbi:DNA primase TraC [mine drainage metagenome]|uniref:DNA primase TraC n=1 Tax=mine drainage metagenome TaxID=410659 RepID=A0A1J5S0L2_9ZZZZ